MSRLLSSVKDIGMSYRWGLNSTRCLTTSDGLKGFSTFSAKAINTPSGWVTLENLLDFLQLSFLSAQQQKSSNDYYTDSTYDMKGIELLSITLIHIMLPCVIFPYLPHNPSTYRLPRWLNSSYPQCHNHEKIDHQPFESLEVALCSALTSL